MASKSAMGRTMIDLRLIGAGVALVTSFGAGWYVQGLRWDADVARIERQATEAREAMRAQYEAQATDYEGFRADNETAETHTKTQIREVFRDVEIPADCAVPDDAVRLLDQARVRANEATGQSGGTVQGD